MLLTLVHYHVGVANVSKDYYITLHDCTLYFENSIYAIDNSWASCVYLKYTTQLCYERLFATQEWTTTPKF